jgi:hypothetical protein
MMVYCTKHFGMYDNTLGCAYCPQRKGVVISLKNLIAAFEKQGIDLPTSSDLYFNELTYRQLLKDPDMEQWLDIIVNIEDWMDPWGNIISGKPVPPITDPIAQLLGATIYIDPSLKDYTVSSKGIVVLL